MDHLEARKLWSAALRSGDYEQCEGRLCRTDDNKRRYCCLGVACELYEKHVGPLERVVTSDTVLNYDNHASNLPEKVANWLKITNHGKLTQHYHRPEASCLNAQYLTSLNDSLKFTFAEIADVIDADKLYTTENAHDN